MIDIVSFLSFLFVLSAVPLSFYLTSFELMEYFFMISFYLPCGIIHFISFVGLLGIALYYFSVVKVYSTYF